MNAAKTRAAQFLIRFAGDRRGATAIEYGLIGALICTVIVTAVVAVSGGLESSLQETSDAVVAVTGGGEAPPAGDD